MSTVALTSKPEQPSTGIVAQPVSTRVLSIDIFRGFTMAVMIFVNDLAGVKGLSRWNHHIPRDVDAMSYVDMVYPFFLFAVGLSLPLAVRQRLRRDPSIPKLWLHIIVRCLTLIVLGLIIANAQSVSAAATHMRGSLWGIFALLGGILFLTVYPKTLARGTTLALRGLGAALLVTMFAIFRRVLPDGHLAWIDFSYPEILGLIGLTYVAVCILYVPTRRISWAPLAWFGALLLFNIACCGHWITSPVEQLTMYAFPFDNGAMAATTMAGVVVSGVFLDEQRRKEPGRQLLIGIGMAVAAAILGLALRPFGISKIRATPTWSLWSVAAATAIFSLFYLLCDVRKRTGWAFLFRSPGANTLLTYLLPDLTYYTLAFFHLNWIFGYWNEGYSGIVRCLAFTLVMLLFSLALTRAKIRVQL